MTRALALLVALSGCSHAPGYPTRGECRERCYAQHPGGPGGRVNAWSLCVEDCCGSRVRAPGESARMNPSKPLRAVGTNR